MKEYYLTSDLFVLPTSEDIWGLGINETLASGLPVIKTKKSVTQIELIEDDKKGTLYR